MSRTLLVETPIGPVMLLMVVLSCYTVYKGVAGSSASRRFSSQRSSPAMAGAGAAACFRPRGSHPTAAGFGERGRSGAADRVPDLLSPFSGTVILLMFWKYASASPKAGMAAYGGYIGAAIVLILINAVVMMVLGPGLAALAALPTLEAADADSAGERDRRSRHSCCSTSACTSRSPAFSLGLCWLCNRPAGCPAGSGRWRPLRSSMRLACWSRGMATISGWVYPLR